jgi:hypothetical protein
VSQRLMSLEYFGLEQPTLTVRPHIGALSCSEREYLPTTERLHEAQRRAQLALRLCRTDRRGYSRLTGLDGCARAREMTPTSGLPSIIANPELLAWGVQVQ